MEKYSENQTWLSERGTVVIQKKHRGDVAQLNDWEHLTYNIWYSDFMLKSGKIDRAHSALSQVRKETVVIATKLNLSMTIDTFRLSNSQFTTEFEERFDAICNELRAAMKTGNVASDSHANREALPRDRKVSLAGQ